MNPSRSNRKKRFALSAGLYRQRDFGKRFLKNIKHFCGIATRQDKCPSPLRSPP